MMHSLVAGVGSYLPEKVVSNDDLAKKVDTSDEWIRKRTGIERRHIAADGEFTSDLGVEAALRAMKHGNIVPEDIDLVILATTTPENTFPATAARIQAKLGIRQGAAYDVQAVCSGFVFALTQADNAIRLGQAKCALVIGAEIYSRILDWEDRSTCVLFGDGAGAVILRAYEGEIDDQGRPQRGILSTHLYTDGQHYDQLYVDGGVATTGTAGHVQMKGAEVFRFAVNNMASSVEAGLAHNGFALADLNWLVPHQANIRIITAVGQKLGVPTENVIITVQEHANTSAATIPIALSHAVADDKFQPGQLVALTAMGGGFTWGSVILRW